MATQAAMGGQALALGVLTVTGFAAAGFAAGFLARRSRRESPSRDAQGSG